MTPVLDGCACFILCFLLMLCGPHLRIRPGSALMGNKNDTTRKKTRSSWKTLSTRILGTGRASSPARAPGGPSPTPAGNTRHALRAPVMHKGGPEDDTPRWHSPRNMVSLHRHARALQLAAAEHRRGSSRLSDAHLFRACERIVRAASGSPRLSSSVHNFLFLFLFWAFGFSRNAHGSRVLAGRPSRPPMRPSLFGVIL